MALPTPPRSIQRVRRDHVLPGTNRLAYYEDLHGTVRSDENCEGKPDICESETDSDDCGGRKNDRDGVSSQVGERASIFKPFAGRRKVLADLERSSVGGDGKVSSIYDNVHLPYHKNNSPAGEPLTPATQDLCITVSLDSTLKTPSKKLTPKKLGFFAKSASMDTMKASSIQYSHNSAGEEMDNLLMTGGLGDLDDSFPLLDEGDATQTLGLLSDGKGLGDFRQTIDSGRGPHEALNAVSMVGGDRDGTNGESRESGPLESAGAKAMTAKSFLLANELNRHRNDRERGGSTRLHETTLLKKPASGRYDIHTSLKQPQAEREATGTARRLFKLSPLAQRVSKVQKVRKGGVSKALREKKASKGKVALKRPVRGLKKTIEGDQGAAAPEVNWQGEKMAIEPGAGFVALVVDGFDAQDYERFLGA